MTPLKTLEVAESDSFTAEEPPAEVAAETAGAEETVTAELNQ